MKKNIDIVIVNWNAGQYLKECIESVIKYSDNLVGKIVVVDNLSTDDSLLLISKVSEVKVVENSENFGFAKACNIGAKMCDSEYILFLNPDARIYKNTLYNCLKFLSDENNRSIGILGVPLEDENGNISRCCARYPTVSNMVSEAMGIDMLIPSLGKSMKEWDHCNTMVVDQVIGAFFLVRMGVYKELNGFDERFFVYYEEVDFSFRAKKQGYDSVYYSGAKAFHRGGVSSSQVLSNRLFYSLRSRAQYFRKHFGVKTFLFVLFVTLLLELPARLFYSIFVMKSYASIVSIFKGYKMLASSFYNQNY